EWTILEPRPSMRPNQTILLQHATRSILAPRGRISVMPTARPFTPTEERIGSTVIHYIAKLNTWIYRRSGGKIFGTWLRGAPVGLLTYRGRKTGRMLTMPLLYLKD